MHRLLFLGTDSYFIIPVMWERPNHNSFDMFCDSGFTVGDFGIFSEFYWNIKENNAPIKTFITITKHIHFSWVFNVKLLNHIIMWSCTYQHITVVSHVGSDGSKNFFFLFSVWMESPCSFMKLFLCMWVAVLYSV